MTQLAIKPSKKMSGEQIEGFLSTLRDLDPEPETELQYTNPYTLLVAVVLSAQSTDAGVNKATKSLFEVVSTPEQMVALGEEGLKEHIKTIGLFNTKAKNVIKLSRQLVELHNSAVPGDRRALEALPGVGRKTANVVLNVVFGEPTMAVDTHIFRLSNRTGLAPGKDPMSVEKALLKRIPKAFMQHAHHWIILHGRYVCKARKPECWRCPVVDFCTFKDKTVAP